MIAKTAELLNISTPTVYTDVKDSGVMLTIRYLVDPRERRGTEQKIWEDILDAFGQEPNIDLAYPTTRFYSLGEQKTPDEKDSHE